MRANILSTVHLWFFEILAKILFLFILEMLMYSGYIIKDIWNSKYFEKFTSITIYLWPSNLVKSETPTKDNKCAFLNKCKFIIFYSLLWIFFHSLHKKCILYKW